MRQSAGIPAAESVAAAHSIVLASSEKVLHIFGGRRDGENPGASLINVKGTLYGTTANGGGGARCARFYRCGTIFSVTTTGTEKVLHVFGSGSDGVYPFPRLINVKGTLYGTTRFGGALGYGIVFSITTTGTERALHSFGGGSDGAYPNAGLVDVDGKLYGTTDVGGGGSGCGLGSEGCGTVFSITTTGTEKVLYPFGGGSDGAQPLANLINVNDTLYGTTTSGGGSGCGSGYGCGTVFSVTTTGTEKVLHRFGGGSDGAEPQASLINVNGTLYGATENGGGGSGCGSCGHGIIFSVTATGTEKVLHRFRGGSDGSLPSAGLIDVNGTLYGTTYFGGGSGCGGGYGCGTVFSVTTTGTEKVRYRFRGGSDGEYPTASLINVKGTLYGTTFYGGSYGCYQNQGCGTVFALTL